MKSGPGVGTVQFTTKGKVVSPARFRQRLPIEDGTKASVVTTLDGILIRPITGPYIKSLRGSLKGIGVMKALLNDRKHERSL